MQITKDIISHVAVLARLRLSSQEEEKYGEQLSSLLDYMDRVQEVSTEEGGVLIQAAGQTHIWREDIPKGESVSLKIVEAFTNKEGALLKVQAIFEDRGREE
ncbi:TPA: Asp-tRNA(Asn)/Glu-tRNA(Gln) amidotransferase subunit GatB [Candidatus Uhrbacteria bacterium]|uniref:Aspartyl/glutamyl-tRNA(Asn/Gln) amidotransferase subunit C n=2 Tax=Candidatus Uhriibacteriota TaxID=1752732 RepID=A0A0G1SGT7_9BACT|nr:MAG: aspartyl/glutamyl-tRNA(asn/Gln) amidotransferase subunit C [Candidatus Uhrbacteria bacterium GW2011_GWF2_46_218]KKU41318.1 MAG: aspartyl/glutamyl-tRNA(asn/Gln) amidotransferase subunit C [Candidatus Uhrbacteria bacterium GW2011_GWE2_46_68]HBK33755.1 Asp-tRNA(Asn)/Glu-tRNA(Gln) amidotransferase subunit GatB [Candidatus Uhrbacteria bacterium]HCB19404.1 Asp-tRNA(Asn)/Glu-tRNA(Gln) amidotransferase subunit GatB [Candidatus Uhrbacteria bacterium]